MILSSELVLETAYRVFKSLLPDTPFVPRQIPQTAPLLGSHWPKVVVKRNIGVSQGPAYAVRGMA